MTNKLQMVPVADSKGGRWGRPPPLLASEIFPQAPFFIYNLAYTLVMCKYPRFHALSVTGLPLADAVQLQSDCPHPCPRTEQGS